MTDARFQAIITACSTIPTAAAAILSAWFAYRSAQLSRSTLDVSRETRTATNGMSSKLVALTAKSSHAEGLLEGRAESRSIDGGTTP
jgi:hypothetical protein